jgi:hypothetical protein
MNKQLFTDVTDWQEATFKVIDSLGLVYHLEQELDELKTDILRLNPDKRLEFADCFILLMGAAKADGMSYEDICSAISEKLEINKKRVWGEPDSNGVINHVKEEEVMCCANCVKMWNVFEKTSAGHVVKSRCTLNPAQPVSIHSPDTHSCTNFKTR